MMPGRSKSGLYEAIGTKPSTPATPRSSSKISRASSTKSDADSNSPLQKGRLSIDRSPKSVESKPSVEYRRPGTADRQSRALKSSELQAQLGALQEDLKKTKEKLALVEKEKSHTLSELKEAKRTAENLNEKLSEALIAQRNAEGSLEIEKFRADELEQVGIEAAEKKDEEWKQETEKIRKEHAVDVAALLSTTQELQRLKHDLAMTTEAKNTALSHADDAMKIAEINADKVGILSGEVSRLKYLLDSQTESKSNEASELVKKLSSEVEFLKVELEKAKNAEAKLTETEALIEVLNVEVSDAKQAESAAVNLVDELKKKAESLDMQLLEAHESEKSSRESLAVITKKLDESNSLLQDAESEMAVLRGKLESMEIEVARHVAKLGESYQYLEKAQEEANKLRDEVGILTSEIKVVEESKMVAENNEKSAASEIEILREEKNKLVNELDVAKDEKEKTMKTMEGLTSALHDVSAEAREAKERLLIKQSEVENAVTEIEELKIALKSDRESYEIKLEESRNELANIKDKVEKCKSEAANIRSEWEEKEINFVKTIQTLEEEIVSFKVEKENLVHLLHGAENEAQIAKNDGSQMLNKLKEAENQLALANEALDTAKQESSNLKKKMLDKETEIQNVKQEMDGLRARESAASQAIEEISAQLQEARREQIEALEKSKTDASMLKERLLDKENELQSIAQENEDLRMRETVALEEVKELTAKLSVMVVKSEENEQPSVNKEDEPALVSRMFEDAVPNGDEHPETDVNSEEATKEDAKPRENGNGNSKAEEEQIDKDSKQNTEKVLESESVDDEADSRVSSEHFYHINGSATEKENGAISPINTTNSHQQKKKKPLLHKFGSLLKKKSNHK